MIYLIYPIILISGFTGLVYQITWQKYLSIYLGSHALSTTLTLSCFFLFLSLGYHVLGKNGHKLGKNRVMTYAYIEALIGLFAIASPALFSWTYDIWPSYPSNSGMHLVSSMGFAFILMGFPTFLMGGTIPILTQGLSQRWKESHKVHAWVYGLNTLGAFVGSLLSGFYLIETFGLAQTLNITGILNCLIFIAILFSTKVTKQIFAGAEPKTNETLSKRTYQFDLLAISFLSGFISFGIESMCIRVAGFSLGSSNYTYSIIVSAFIFSIALGSLLAGRLQDRKDNLWLILTQSGIVTTLIALYLTLPFWPDIFSRVRMVIAPSLINFSFYWFFIFLLISLTLMVPVTLMGATLPLLFQKLRSQDQQLNSTAGLMYAINAIGATLGAILAGYLLMTWLRYDQVFLLLIIVALIPLLLLSRGLQNKKWIQGIILLSSLLAIWALPTWKDTSFIPSRFNGSSTISSYEELDKYYDVMNNKGPDPVQFLFSNHGVNTYTTVTEDSKKERSLFVNAKPDANTGGDISVRHLNALIPLSFAKKRTNIFIVGLGTGLSASVAASFEDVKSIKISEIAQGAIDALPFFEKWNFNLEKNIHKTSITNDDAYKVLRHNNQKFNLIFSEPSNTWVTGVEKLFTEEFLSLAASRLDEDGIYSQWFPLFGVTEASFLATLHNFKKAFPYVTLWSSQGAASLILASHKPIQPKLEELAKLETKYKNLYEAVKVEKAQDLLFRQIWSDSAITDLSSHAPIEHSLVKPTLAFESARAVFISNILDLEHMASKFFIEKKKFKNDPPLIWQSLSKNLDKSFFDNASKFYESRSRFSFAAGRITLEKARLFSDWKKKDSKTKITQYLYLQDLQNKKIPKSTSKDKKDSHVLAELFSRYKTLKKMRESAYFSQVLKAAPKKCNNDSCLLSKVSIMLFDKKITDKDVKVFTKGIKNDITKEKVDKLFNELMSSSLN